MLLLLVCVFYVTSSVPDFESLFSLSLSSPPPLAVKKSFLGFNKSLWGPLELVEKLCPEAAEISASVRDLPGLK